MLVGEVTKCSDVEGGTGGRGRVERERVRHDGRQMKAERGWEEWIGAGRNGKKRERW